MNKKFLSAILFGALMATSAGTFVSCKDYDDDIKNLQTQIDTNKTAIAELQKLVGAGNWVTNVAASGESLVVTMSNGTSATIAGIKGADGKDGKNAAEWTIGEDGFWYVNGEKTANVAVAQNGKDGKDGVTAPSPKIENGVWVVYNWDAAKGEFVEEVTEISAAGTSAYVVLKDGAYILNIADENGEFVEVSLPATAESFSTNAISNTNVEVVFTYGEWKTPTTKEDKKIFDKLAAEFPELKEKKNKDLVEQGGKLPFIVSPANVVLTKEHAFALVDMKGKDAGATLTNPTKGMPENLGLVGGKLQSRAAEGAAVWSVDFAPALNKKGNGYVSSNSLYSLEVSGPKGIISATPYVYSYSIAPATEALKFNYTSVTKLYNEEGMDIFAQASETDGYITLPATTLKGMFILEATDPAQAEEYGVEIEGSVVKVKNMPKGKNIGAIDLKLSAIAVNGSVWADDFTLAVNNEIAATGALADLEETLTGTYVNGKFNSTKQTIWWSLEELELSPLQMSKFYGAERHLVIKNDEGKLVYDSKQEEDELVTIYSAKNANKVADSYTKAAYIAAKIDVSKKYILPGEYTVELTAVADGTTILKAESNLTLANPETSLWTIKDTFLDANSVVIAATNAPTYQFGLDKIFKLEANTEIAGYVDLDNEYDPATYVVTWLNNNVISAGLWNNNKTEVDKVRTIKVTFNLFGNENNQEETEIKVKWTSSIYAENAADVITMTPAKLKIKFDDPTSTDANKVKFTSITSAIYAQGALKGQAYRLFDIANGTVSGTGSAAKFDYSDWATAAGYVVNGDGNPVSLTKANYLKLVEVLNIVAGSNIYSPETKYVEGTDTYLLKDEHLNKIWSIVDLYYNDDLTTDYYKENGALYYVQWKNFAKNENGVFEFTSGLSEKTPAYAYLYNNKGSMPSDELEIARWTQALTVIPENHQKVIDFFNTIKSSIKFTKTSNAVTGDTKYDDRAAEIKSINFNVVNEADANFFTMTAPETEGDYKKGATLTAKSSATIDKTALVEGKKVIPMEMIITDVWGKKMTIAFNVEISL